MLVLPKVSTKNLAGDIPPELLVCVATLLSTKDLLNVRRTCRALAAAGASALRARFHVLYFAPTARSARIFSEVCSSPFFRQHIREVIYVGETTSRPFYSPGSQGWDANVLCLSEIDLEHVVPELNTWLWGGDRAAKWNSIHLHRALDCWRLCEGILKLPRLKRVNYISQWPSLEGYNRSYRFYDQSSNCARVQTTLRVESLGICVEERVKDDLVTTTYNNAQSELFSETPEWTQDDWIGILQVLEATRRVLSGGRSVTLCIQDISLVQLLKHDRAQRLTHHHKLQAFFSVMPLLTCFQLDVGFDLGCGEACSQWANILNSAIHLKRLWLRWDDAESSESDLLNSIFRTCTWPRLEQLEIIRPDLLFEDKSREQESYVEEELTLYELSRLVSFLDRHRYTLCCLRLHNVFKGVYDPDAEEMISADTSEVRLKPLRVCLWRMPRLQWAEITFDTFSGDEDWSLPYLQNLHYDMVQFMLGLGLRPVRRVLRSKTWPDIMTFDTGQWLLQGRLAFFQRLAARGRARPGTALVSGR